MIHLGSSDKGHEKSFKFSYLLPMSFGPQSLNKPLASWYSLYNYRLFIPIITCTITHLFQFRVTRNNFTTIAWSDPRWAEINSTQTYAHTRLPKEIVSRFSEFSTEDKLIKYFRTFICFQENEDFRPWAIAKPRAIVIESAWPELKRLLWDRPRKAIILNSEHARQRKNTSRIQNRFINIMRNEN